MLKGFGKRGDTLIEVTLAVGIFSMVAVTIVAVVNNSTNGVQGALESTIAREAIDTQAEALRFIHSAYVADAKNDGSDGSTEKNIYTETWKKIAENAVDATDAATQYNPTSCENIYSNSSPNRSKYFALDTDRLSSGASAVVQGNKLKVASTFPRIVHGNTATNDTLLGQDSGSLSSVEGLFILGVKNAKDTVAVVEGANIEKVSAYYDFYIRTCWYAPGESKPSTVSTVIRLYDPLAVKDLAPNTFITLAFQKVNNDYEPEGEAKTVKLAAENKYTIPNPDTIGLGYTEANNSFVWWTSAAKDLTSTSSKYRFCAGDELEYKYENGSGYVLNVKRKNPSRCDINLYRTWLGPSVNSMEAQFRTKFPVGNKETINLYAQKEATGANGNGGFRLCMGNIYYNKKDGDTYIYEKGAGDQILGCPMEKDILNITDFTRYTLPLSDDPVNFSNKNFPGFTDSNWELGDGVYWWTMMPDGTSSDNKFNLCKGDTIQIIDSNGGQKSGKIGYLIHIERGHKLQDEPAGCKENQDIFLDEQDIMHSNAKGTAFASDKQLLPITLNVQYCWKASDNPNATICPKVK